MDAYDFPKYSPVVNNRPLRWSVGKFLGKRRVVIAWFDNEQDAKDYAERCRSHDSFYKYDYLKSLF